MSPLPRIDGAIPPIKKERYPSRMMVFDTEAYRSIPVDGVELQTLRLGVAYYAQLDADCRVYSDEFYNFTTTEGLLDFIEYKARYNKTLYIYAHNLRYDLQLSGLYTALVSVGWQTSTFVMESPPTFIKMHKGRNRLVFVDTFNYWQFSVEAMGEQLGLPKLRVDFNTVTTEDLFIYCKRDVEVLTNYLLSFIRFLIENDLCGLGFTLASQAFRSYRYRFMSTEIILHNRPEVLKLERQAYFGGRCEAFYIGEKSGETFYKLDVNSMYPHVMVDNYYPVKFVSYSENVPIDYLGGLLDAYYCLSECDIKTSTPSYAYVREGKLTFPVGEFRAYLNHSDLVKARQGGIIRQVVRIAVYEKAKIFSDYVSFFYHLKLDAEARGDKITRHQAKIFLNSLYGKFGQRQIISKIVPYDGETKFIRLVGYCEPLGRNIEVNYLGNSIEVRYKEGESYYSFPAIAGAVTAYARSYLWEIIERAGRSNVFYCDTDSVIVNAVGLSNLSGLLHASKIGCLKVEGEATHLVIHSSKDYIFGDEIKVKGVPKTAVPLAEGVWEYEQFRGAKTWMAEGMTKGVEVYTRIKERKTPYDKGVIMPDGTVSPLSLPLLRDG